MFLVMFPVPSILALVIQLTCRSQLHHLRYSYSSIERLVIIRVRNYSPIISTDIRLVKLLLNCHYLASASDIMVSLQRYSRVSTSS